MRRQLRAPNTHSTSYVSNFRRRSNYEIPMANSLYETRLLGIMACLTEEIGHFQLFHLFIYNFVSFLLHHSQERRKELYYLPVSKARGTVRKINTSGMKCHRLLFSIYHNSVYSDSHF